MHVIMPWVGAKMLLTDRIASQTRLCCKGVGCDVKMESEPTHNACSHAVFGTVGFHHPRTPYLSDHSVDQPLMPSSEQENQRPEHQQSTLYNRGEGFLINCINSGITYVRVLSRVDYQCIKRVVKVMAVSLDSRSIYPIRRGNGHIQAVIPNQFYYLPHHKNIFFLPQDEYQYW